VVVEQSAITHFAVLCICNGDENLAIKVEFNRKLPQ